MNALLLKAYHRLPSPARDAVASARGRQLKRLRYGPETERLVEEALEREHWTPAQWESWRQERVVRLLQRAATRVPYYRDLWSARGNGGRGNGLLDCWIGGKRGDFKELGNWPVLKKQALRAAPKQFLADDCNPRRMTCEHTSGTTGTPLTLWQSRETIRAWYALAEARWRGWYGLSRRDPWAILGGQLVVPVERTRPPFWVWNSALNQLYLSVNHLSPANARAYLGALSKYQVQYVLGYASALFSLASFVRAQRLSVPPLRAALSNAEPLYAHQKEVISNAFGCPAWDTYGSSEMVCAASECRHGAMHLWPEAGVWEVLREDSDLAVGPGETGRLVCTGLLNTDMPLIRYEVGDRVALAKPGAICPCGRTLPILKSVEGRIDDVIVTPDGRRIGRLDPVFKADFPISEAQIIQDSPDHLRVLVVPANGFNAAVERSLTQALRARVGDMRITIEKVDSIPRTRNGKFKAVVVNVPQGSLPHTETR